jgi:hypothetical protein
MAKTITSVKKPHPTTVKTATAVALISANPNK